MSNYSDNSVDLIYGEREIGQLSFDDAKKVLNECYRILRPGGVIRVAIENLGIGAAVLNHVWKQKGLCSERRLRLCLRQCGFRGFESRHQGESRHAELCFLETRPESTLIVEARKQSEKKDNPNAHQEQLNRYLGTKHSLAVANGTAAIHLALLGGLSISDSDS